MSNKPDKADDASSMPVAVKHLSVLIASKVARKHFEERGNHTETHISEDELTALCAVAIATAVEMMSDVAAKMAEEMKPKPIRAFVSRRVVIHVGRDGTINYLDTQGVKGPIYIEGTVPLCAVDSEAQAIQLQKQFGTRQFRTNQLEPSKPWYILHHLPDGSILSDRKEPYLEVKEMEAIGQMFDEWLVKTYGKGGLS